MTTPPNIALLIDADIAPPTGLDAVLTVLAELGSVNIRRAYGNWSKAGLKGWSAIAHRYAIEPQQQFDLTKGKNATDIKIAIDAMDLLYSGRVDGFGLMTSDSDFMPVAMRIRQNSLPVYRFGSERTPEGFRQACTRFIDIDAMAEKENANGNPQPVDDALVTLLGDASKDSKRDENGFASLGEVGNRAGSRSSFDARNYAFARLSDLVELLPQFTIERREGGKVYIRRLR